MPLLLYHLPLHMCLCERTHLARKAIYTYCFLLPFTLLSASPQPLLPVTGVIRVRNDDTSTDIGYLSNILNEFGEFANTRSSPFDFETLRVEIPGAIFESGGSFFNLPSPVSAACAPTLLTGDCTRRNYLTCGENCSGLFPLIMLHALPICA
jgi:hypothetical protein